MTETETLHVCNGETVTPKLKCTEEESESGEEAPEVQNGVAFKEPPLLREVDPELLQSGKLKYTGEFLVNHKLNSFASLDYMSLKKTNKLQHKNCNIIQHNNTAIT